MSVGVGARVMITVNIDVADGLANGVCGTVTGIDHTANNVNTIFVKFDSDRVGTKAINNSQHKQAYPQAVPIKRKDVQFFIGRGARRSVEAKRTQFPLTLAWGCTIHKVQGKTLDTIVVSMEGKGRFMPGQAYVALSRVKTLQGLFLLEFDQKAIKVHPAVVQEMKRLHTVTAQEEELPEQHMSPTSALNIKLLNIQSYRPKVADLKTDPELGQADVLCFVETFLKDEHHLHAQDLILQDAQCFRKDRQGTTGGGVMTVASNNISPTELPVFTQDLECTAITITKATTTFNVITIYRPPSLSLVSFQTKLENLILSLPTETITIILGDFNIDLLKHPTHNFLYKMEALGFHQHVTDQTTDYGSLLDHVYTNTNSTVPIQIADIYYSDHDMVSVSVPVT